MGVIQDSDAGFGRSDLVTDIKQGLAAELWGWFETHKDRVIFEKRIFRLFTVKLTIGDLEHIFIELFGQRSF